MVDKTRETPQTEVDKMTETLTRDLKELVAALYDEADMCEMLEITKPAYLMREAASVIHVGCSATMDMFTEGKPALEQLAMAAGMVSALNQGSGSCVYSVCSPPCAGVSQEHLQRFAELVRADERQRLLADLSIAMQHSAWDGVLQLDDAMRNIGDALVQGPKVRGNAPTRAERTDDEQH